MTSDQKSRGLPAESMIIALLAVMVMSVNPAASAAVWTLLIVDFILEFTGKPGLIGGLVTLVLGSAVAVLLSPLFFVLKRMSAPDPEGPYEEAAYLHYMQSLYRWDATKMESVLTRHRRETPANFPNDYMVGADNSYLDGEWLRILAAKRAR